MDNYSLNERIDNLAIAYIKATCNTEDMSVDEFVDLFNDISAQIFKKISNTKI